jgi:polar amino acid transport system substrate-binding protein
MINRIFPVFLFVMLCMTGCGAGVGGTKGSPDRKGTGKFKTPADLADKKIGVLLGSLYDKYATTHYPDAQIFQYQTVPDQMIALNTRKIDAVYFPETQVYEMLKSNPDLGILAKDIFFVPVGAGFNRDNDGLRIQFNEFLKEIRANGVYDDMHSRWMKEGIKEMPEVKAENPSGQLRTGVVNDMGMPMALVVNGNLVGFDIELSSRFAAWLGREYVPVPLAFGSLIASISTNKIDIITASMAMTEERAKMIDFSDPYHDSGVTIVARKDAIDPSVIGEVEGKAPGKPLVKRISESFYSNLILEKRYLMILDGLKLTIIISILAALLGTLLGGLVCAMRMSPNTILSSVAIAYINLLRGTPVLVLLMVVYYVVFASVNINPGLVAVIAFSMNFGAYVSEMFRTSIQSVEKGQTEAGIAGGFTKIQTFIHIVGPQALRHLLPVYKGEFISLVKMTSIVGYIAVQDLTKASDIIRSRTFDAFFPLILAALIYLALAWLLTWALGRVEIRVEGRRRTEDRRRRTTDDR